MLDGLAARLPARDAGIYPLVLQRISEPIGVIATVSQQPVRLWQVSRSDDASRRSCASPHGFPGSRAACPAAPSSDRHRSGRKPGVERYRGPASPGALHPAAPSASSGFFLMPSTPSGWADPTSWLGNFRGAGQLLNKEPKKMPNKITMSETKSLRNRQRQPQRKLTKI
jgi:hypothetical protein